MMGMGSRVAGFGREDITMEVKIIELLDISRIHVIYIYIYIYIRYSVANAKEGKS